MDSISGLFFPSHCVYFHSEKIETRNENEKKILPSIKKWITFSDEHMFDSCQPA